MPEEPANELPESLRAWVEERATASETDTAEVIARAVAVYKLVEEHAMQGEETLSDVETFGQRLGELESTSAALRNRLASVEDNLDGKIADVRERVIQVKRETDEKAPKDHDHPELVDQLEAADERLDELAAVVDDVEQTVDTGFENRKEILTYLADETEELTNETTELNEGFKTLARAVDNTRQQIKTLEQQVERQGALDDLKRSANRQGIKKGQCGNCGNQVTLGLLTEPNCPHCEERFTDIDPPGRFFGTATLKTGSFPALTADPPGEGPTAGTNRDTESTDEPAPETVSELFDHTGESKDD